MLTFLNKPYKSRKRTNNIKKINNLINVDKKTDNQDREIVKKISIDNDLIVNIEIVTIRKIVR